MSARATTSAAMAFVPLLGASILCMLGGPVASASIESTHASATTVLVRVLHLVDRSRSIRLSRGRVVPRPVTTYVRYPSTGAGPWPLIVFGEGYAATPGIYAHLLDAWALAGYVVAAPLFPLGNAHAPGGPDESDVVNQPRDMSFVISQLQAASRIATDPLHGLIDTSRIAVAGQSDGGETAFAAAYDQGFRDPRVDAAVILSGAQIPGVAYAFPRGSPPLLAVQGTADTTNRPRYTYSFYAAAPRPKFLLRLLRAGHIGPYTTEEPQRTVVEQTTTAFLNVYLKRGSVADITRAAAAPGIAKLTAAP